MSAPPRLALEALTKRYGAHTALAALDLALPAGSIHGILGENGAGKSTLVRLIAGAVRPDAGRIHVDGTPLAGGDPRAARAAGIGVVHQHFALVGAMSVAENLALGRPETGFWLPPGRLVADAAALARAHGLEIGDPTARCDALPVGTLARVEILRALSAAPRVLLLDEPTAVLTPAETAELFATLRVLRDGGLLVLFVTHKLGEALALCDAVTVLRAGKLVRTVAARGVAAAELARLMVGAEPQPRSSPATTSSAPAAALVVSGLSTTARPGGVSLHDVGLTVGRGEICGVAGVDGNGQDELAAALAGLVAHRGTVAVGATTVAATEVRAAEAVGLALIPGDRRRAGLAATMTVWENALLSAPLLTRFTRRGALRIDAARDFAAGLVRDYRIAAPSLDHPVATLSGGNQQRVVIGRALAAAPRVLVAVNPTRGLDIAAAAHVHGLLTAAASEGCAVLLFSTDLDELASVCDRLFVLYRGRLTGPVAPAERARIGSLMAGVAP